MLVAGQAYAARYDIGVLAFNGRQQAVERWKPTADYLTRHIADAEFHIVPLTLDEFQHALNKQELDFVLTNPGHYVRLEVTYGATRIVTFLSRHRERVLKYFSSVVFTRVDSDIKSLADLKGRSLAAVSEDAFGGFQLARLELERLGIDPMRQIDLLWLGFPHGDIVTAVLEGRADAGTVRAGILERMASSDNIDLNRLRILGERREDGFPYLHSSGLYPEWPFAKLPHTDIGLAKKVAVILLEMPSDAAAALQAGGAGWTIPLDYAVVHDVLKQLQVEPYPAEAVDVRRFVDSYRGWIGLVVGLFLMLVMIVLRLVSANRELTDTRNALQDHRRKLEDTVQERTDDLLQANAALQIEIASHIEAEKVMDAGCRALQALHDTFVRTDLGRQQKLNSVVDSVRIYLGAELAMLSSVRPDGFEACSVSPLDCDLAPPLDAGLVELAIQERQIISRENLPGWRRYIASPVFIRGELCCVFEFADSLHFQREEEGAESPRINAELCLRILNLISQWVGNETMLLAEERQHQSIHRRFEGLSRRENQVLELLIQGDSTKVMARKLDLSTKTIEMHRASLLRKTAAKSSTELVQLAVNANVFSSIQ